MANYCIVAPPHILQDLDKHHALGRYHLLLAHDIVKPEKAPIYARLFKKRTKEMVVILDNSVAELGNAVDLEMIVEAAQIVKPTVTILPDVYLNSDATIRSCLEALDPWTNAFHSRNLPARFGYIPQGKTEKEFVRAAQAFAFHDQRITWWGVPRNLVPNLITREYAIKLVKALIPDRSIHMMGFSDNMVDDLLCAQMPEVDTIDSAVPMRVPWKFDLLRDPGKRGDWWETAQPSAIMYNNLVYARRMFGGKGTPLLW